MILKKGHCDQCGDDDKFIAKTLPISGRWCIACNTKRLDVSKAQRDVVVKDAVKRSRDESLTSLIKELDKVFSLYIRSKDAVGGRSKCVTCGSTWAVSSMDCGHWQKRGNFAIRWDERNCGPQCFECNRMNDGEYKKFEQYIIATHGIAARNELIGLKNNSRFKIDRAWVKEKIGYYKLKMEDME